MKKIISISSLILVIGFLLGYVISKCNLIKEVEISVVVTFIGISYAYFQFQFEKIQTEKRRIKDIKLSVYNNLTHQANIILEDCSKFFIDYHPQSSKDDKRNIVHICITLPVKINGILADIENYNNLLNTKISDSYIRGIEEVMTPIAKSLSDYKSIDEIGIIYQDFHKKIVAFTENLYNELLLR